MKKLVTGTGVFFRTLKRCLSEAWRDSDCQYHIPKSRFNGSGSVTGQEVITPGNDKTAPRNAFVGTFRDCVVSAWEATDSQYNIPKSRYQDAEFNQAAYRSSGGSGLLGRLGTFFHTLSSCISASWEASDTFYHLPRSKYQEADFIRDLMKLSPEPRGKLVYRPYTIGMGTVVSDGTGKGWTVKLPKEKPGEVLVAPEALTDPGSTPELEF